MSGPPEPRPLPPGVRPFVIGLAGGTCSGKTTIASAIVEQAGPDGAALIAHDAYYRHRPDLTPEERAGVNYDHPDSLETELLLTHLADLAAGKTIAQPTYDFTRHLRNERTVPVFPRPVILLEGILVLADAELRRAMDLKVFADADPDIRALRRVVRDIRERGRSLESVVGQYHATVRPMHLRFVEPSRRCADLIIPRGGDNRAAVEALLAVVRETVRRLTAPAPGAEKGG